MKRAKGGRGDSVDGIINYANNRKLWAEVLKLAVLDLQEKNSALKKAAHVFIKSDDLRFPSFVSICRALDLDPQKIRDRLLFGNVTKKSFQVTIMRCCGCGDQHQITLMKKLQDFGMYTCKRCQRALSKESN